MRILTEQGLLKKARAFNVSALGIIYDQFSPGLYRYAMRLLGDENLAEDCVSDTFSRFLNSLRAGQGPKTHLQAYLYRVAHNWITDSYRRQAPLSVELDENLRDRDTPLMENLQEKKCELDQLRIALRSLTPDQRQVIVLRFIEDWKNEDVAEAMQKPVGAVKALQHRALETLRRLLSSNEKVSHYEFSE